MASLDERLDGISSAQLLPAFEAARVSGTDSASSEGSIKARAYKALSLSTGDNALPRLETRQSIRRASLNSISQKIGRYSERFSIADNFHQRQDLSDGHLQLLLLLLALGCAATLVAYTVTYGAERMGLFRMEVCAAIPSTRTNEWRYTWMCGSAAALAALASFIVMKHPQAGGSGLPEVKETLAGIVLFDSFSLKTLGLKMVALALAIASGLSVGKEGPLVHLSCAVAHQLITFAARCGTTFHKKDLRRHELFVAACALGVVCTFGCPVGGVIFAIEIVSTFYMLEHLPSAFFVVSWGMLFIRQINTLGDDLPGNPFALFSTSFEVPGTFPLSIHLCFMLVGVLGAPLALLQERCVSWFASNVQPYTYTMARAPTAAATVAALCAACYLYLSDGKCGDDAPHPMLPQGGAPLLDHLFSQNALNVSLPKLAVFFVLKLTLLTPASLTQAVPTGVFLPCFAAGAAYGRLIGELLCWMAPNFIAVYTSPGHFAIIGAAALTAAATGTMSTAVVCLELTGQLSLQLPILVATVAGYLAAQALNVTSLFDVFIRLKNLPGSLSTVKPTAIGVPWRSAPPVHALEDELGPPCQICLCDNSGAALGSSHASKTRRRGTSVQMGLYGRLHHIRLPRHVTHAKVKAFMPKQRAFMQQTGVAFVPVVSSDEAGAFFVGCVYFHLLEDVLGEFEDALGVASSVTEETLDLLWDDGPASEARDKPPREGAELAPLQISKHMRLSRVTFLFRMLGVSYACVTENGRLLGVLTRLDLVEEEKIRTAAPRGAFPHRATVACLGISRGSSRRSSTASTVSYSSEDTNHELL